MLRKIASVGDPITSGGTILQNGNSTAKMGEGHLMALIGGSARCESCKSIGQIEKAGGPRRLNFMGEVALEGDVVMCKCAQHPRLVAQLHQTAKYDDLAETLGILPLVNSDSSSVLVNQTGAAAAPEFYEYFQLVDQRTGQPLIDSEYAITRNNGRIEHGLTSDKGNTHMLASTATTEEIDIKLSN